MMKKIFAILLSLTAAVSLAMLSVSAESLEIVEAALPPVDPSQTYEVIIIPEETTTPVVTTTVQTAKPVVTTGATTISITTAGAAETTGNPFDLKLTDSQSTNFFIVSDGTNNFFTRYGS
mgnify:CR=1 FL=1